MWFGRVRAGGRGRQSGGVQLSSESPAGCQRLLRSLPDEAGRRTAARSEQTTLVMELAMELAIELAIELVTRIELRAPPPA